jgi:hypothetical protein
MAKQKILDITTATGKDWSVKMKAGDIITSRWDTPYPYPKLLLLKVGKCKKKTGRIKITYMVLETGEIETVEIAKANYKVVT